MLIDTHCHLNFKAFANDLADVVRRAKETGVEKIIVPGTDLKSCKRAIDIAQQFPGICYAAIGIHPHHVQDPNLIINDKLLQKLENLVKQGSQQVVAIGEIGLDFYQYQKTKYYHNQITDEIKQKQKQLFLMQLHLAVIHKKPVILHCRQACEDLIQILKNFSRIDRRSLGVGGQHLSPIQINYIKQHHLTGVWHCFSGNNQQLMIILTMGYFVGFDGNITYSNNLQQLVASTPLERLLLETDSPYLAPIPYRNQRNEPANLAVIAQTLAEIKHVSPALVIKTSTANARSLFKLD